MSEQFSEPMFIHYVRDMDRALNFYTSVFDIRATFTSPGWSTLDFGAFVLALHILSSHDMEDSPMPNAGLNLLVDSIETMQSRIEKHGGRLRELREPDAFVPVRVASFFDCEQNGFELRQNP